MRQRLALAVAFLADPQVLVLDEPLNGLDPEGIVWVRDTIRHLAAQGRTVLLSSHLLAEVAQTVDDVVVIAGGRLVAAGPLDTLATGARTVVSSPHVAALTTALLARGHDVRRVGNDEIEVIGVNAEVVGRIAAQEGAVVTGLREVHDDDFDVPIGLREAGLDRLRHPVFELVLRDGTDGRSSTRRG